MQAAGAPSSSAATSIHAAHQRGCTRLREAAPALLQQLVVTELAAIETIPAASWPSFHPLHRVKRSPLLEAVITHHGGSEEAAMAALAPLLEPHGLELWHNIRDWHTGSYCAGIGNIETSAVARLVRQVHAARQAALVPVWSALTAPNNYPDVVQILFKAAFRQGGTPLPLPQLDEAVLPPEGPHRKWVWRNTVRALGSSSPYSADSCVCATYRGRDGGWLHIRQLYSVLGGEPWRRLSGNLWEVDEVVEAAGRELRELLAPCCACQRGHPPLLLPTDPVWNWQRGRDDTSNSSSSGSEEEEEEEEDKEAPPCPVCIAPWAAATSKNGPNAAQMQALAEHMGVAAPAAARELLGATHRAVRQWRMARRCAAARAVRRWQQDPANIARLEAAIAGMEDKTALEVPADLKAAADDLPAADWAALWHAWGLTGSTATERLHCCLFPRPPTFFDVEEGTEGNVSADEEDKAFRLRTALCRCYKAAKARARAACRAWLAQADVRAALLDAAEGGAAGVRFCTPPSTPPAPTAFKKQRLINAWQEAVNSVLVCGAADAPIHVHIEATATEPEVQEELRPRRDLQKVGVVGRAVVVLAWASGCPLRGIKDVAWPEPLPMTTYQL